MTRWYRKLRGFFDGGASSASPGDDDYRVLGLAETASDAEIEQAYRRLIAQYHPDRLVGVAEDLRRQAERHAGEINAAYDRVKAQRKQSEDRDRRPESKGSAMVPSAGRGPSGALPWLALGLVALVAIAVLTRLPVLRAPAPSQAPPPIPDASTTAEPGPVVEMPASPTEPVVASPAPAPAAGQTAPADDMLVLMPKDPPPVQAVSSPPPASPVPAAPTSEAALVDAVRAGQLRPATEGDLSRWSSRWSAANGRSLPSGFGEHSRFMPSYVIQTDFTIPDGLTGAHAVIFLLEPRVPYPRGNPGHSVVLDLSTGACTGMICGMLLQ